MATLTRRHPSYVSILPTLIREFSLHETNTPSNHDIELPLPKKSLKIILLSERDLTESTLEGTLTRITSPTNINSRVAVIILLPQTPTPRRSLLGYTRLQASLTERGGLHTLIPITSPDQLPRLLQDYTKALLQRPPPNPPAEDLLSQATANPPMPPRTRAALGKIFPNISSLSHAISTGDSRLQTLRTEIGEVQFKEITNFWQADLPVG
ncbi:hypothetical protein K470DRAFT_272532 [Piedraia hortae CBS 480.64]|uniref:Uncharacterized protein n=1 Tax=Piedraia hortae CBS 480.64 TaxID=1314780 RepID=A0A6A7BSX1_9PEZI|nr:hypothetical protein K470DRAFT_272532 [Piedraia hortae CBS 480.64]